MLTVICGIIRNERGELFIARRRPGKSFAGKWEFPGGKLEAGESPESCLKRELLEEFGMSVETGVLFGEQVHHYPDFAIRLIALECTFHKADFVLSDHDRFEWVRAVDLPQFEFTEADHFLVERLSAGA